MDWGGINFRGKRPNKETVHFFKLLHFDDNHLYKKILSTKIVLLGIFDLCNENLYP